MDPTIFSSILKKAKNMHGDDAKSAKFAPLPTVSTITNAFVKPSFVPTVQKVKASKLLSTPAGCSPQKKRAGILSRHRRPNPFTRVDPPSLRAKLFSIDAALSGSVASPEPKGKEVIDVPLLEECMPRKWMFKIHEDTKEEEEDILMQHSTGTLDISDDEESRAAKSDRGKENVPPADSVYAIAPAHSERVAAKDMMTEEVRSPLGDLNPKDFYAADCDATSVIIVPAEEATVNESTNASDSKIELSNPIPAKFDFGSIDAEVSKESKDAIDIWESESAKDESEVTKAEDIAV